MAAAALQRDCRGGWRKRREGTLAVLWNPDGLCRDGGSGEKRTALDIAIGDHSPAFVALCETKFAGKDDDVNLI